MVTYRPFEEPLMQRLEVYNELTMIILIYCIISFSPLNQSVEESELTLSLTFLAFLCSNILVHLYFLLKDTFVQLKDKLQRLCCKKAPKPEQRSIAI